jgi:hypothetical protein
MASYRSKRQIMKDPKFKAEDLKLILKAVGSL